MDARNWKAKEKARVPPFYLMEKQRDYSRDNLPTQVRKSLSPDLPRNDSFHTLPKYMGQLSIACILIARLQAAVHTSTASKKLRFATREPKMAPWGPLSPVLLHSTICKRASLWWCYSHSCWEGEGRKKRVGSSTCESAAKESPSDCRVYFSL